MIATLQEQLSDEKSRARELEGELRAELGKLGKTCGEQQQVINQVINKGPANQVEACLQHEISRLTGENFDLREKIESLQETVKRIKRQLKAYMKKLNEVGAALPETAEPLDGDLEISKISSNGPSDMPMVRKKEHDFLGMFEYKKEQEQQVLKALIYGELLNAPPCKYYFHLGFFCRSEAQDGSQHAAGPPSIRPIHDDPLHRLRQQRRERQVADSGCDLPR